MKEMLSQMKDINIVEPLVTIRSTVKEDTRVALNELADRILR